MVKEERIESRRVEEESKGRIDMRGEEWKDRKGNGGREDIDEERLSEIDDES